MSVVRSLLGRSARFMARYPWLHLLAGFVLSIGLSAVGNIVGDFAVEADNAGWQSRGTLIADRHAQVLLAVGNRWSLTNDATYVWDDYINNVQPTWEEDDGSGDSVRTRRNRRQLMSNNQGTLLTTLRKMQGSRRLGGGFGSPIPATAVMHSNTTADATPTMESRHRDLQLGLGSCDID